MTLIKDHQSYTINVEDAAAYRLQGGTFWSDFTIFSGSAHEIRVDGLPNERGVELRRAIDAALSAKRIREDAEYILQANKAATAWARKVQEHLNVRRWFTHEMQHEADATRPTELIDGMDQRLKNPDVVAFLGQEARNIEDSKKKWGLLGPFYYVIRNLTHTQNELVACKDLFDRVERQPLTKEQARAVICFDNRVQVVASAGSGKTSTMVAKAAYAIHRGLVAPERIVLLAFNKQAAEELRERAAQAFQRLGMEGIQVETSTFHALGLSIIGKATGERPDIPEWAIDPAAGMRKMAELIDTIKDQSPAFRAKWDLFRFVFKRDLPELGTAEPPDVWNAQGQGELLTARGERVKSLEEAMIGDWLFYNGVNYQYETSYEVRTATESHRQYKPDFYYPDIKLYHEHFALDAQGQAPAHFKDYLDGVKWKRVLHSEMKTDLIETTSHGIRNGNDLERLGAELTARGMVLDPNPDRPIPQDGLRPMESQELMGLIRVFMSHAKSNSLSPQALRQRMDAQSDTTFKTRHQMFLDLTTPIMAAWDAALAAEDGIDFEDMLNQAAAHVESGRYDASYELVMADEFQDASRARARLCRALVQKPGRFLFAVGDDWQSINRFAGADVSVMTRFKEWFGSSQILKLEQTFRCPQALCDVSSAFISKNPAQITKAVQSVAPDLGPVLQAFQVDGREKIASAIDRFVMQLAEGVRQGTIPPGPNGKVSVYVLGRYNADRQHVPGNPYRYNREVDISFLSIHRSKGSEADYVILPEMLSEFRRRSFPSTRTDDPVLALAMPDGDDYPLGEERRLFYVALTRARRSVAMFTSRGLRSSFLSELADDGAVVITDVDGTEVQEEHCPACTQGVMVQRTGPYGEFQSCSNFPYCRYKPPQRRSSLASFRGQHGQR
ncbi:MAG: UvrD-helicase domain-containing protein [Devosia sp.]